jgi:hypothetical protein
MTQLYMIVGPHQFLQFNGMVVEAQETAPMYDEVADTYTALYLTQPASHAPNGQAIYWQHKNLFPLQNFPKEELQEELQTV